MSDYEPVGYTISLGKNERPFFTLDKPLFREITAPDEDGRSWRVKSTDDSQSFRVQATGRTLDPDPPSAEVIKIALVLAVRDEVARLYGSGGKPVPKDHPANMTGDHLAEARRMASAPSA